MVWKVRVKDLIPLPIIQMRKLRHRAEESHTQVLGASKWWLRMQVSVTLNLELATTRDPAWERSKDGGEKVPWLSLHSPAGSSARKELSPTWASARPLHHVSLQGLPVWGLFTRPRLHHQLQRAVQTHSHSWVMRNAQLW